MAFRSGRFHERTKRKQRRRYVQRKDDWLLNLKAEPSLYVPSFRLLVWDVGVRSSLHTDTRGRPQPLVAEVHCTNLVSACRDTPTRIAGKATLHRRSKGSDVFTCKRRTFLTR